MYIVHVTVLSGERCSSVRVSLEFGQVHEGTEISKHKSIIIQHNK